MVHLIASLAVSASFPPTSACDALASHPDLLVAVSRAQRTIRSESGNFVGEQPGRFQFSATSSGRLSVDDLSIRTVAFGNGPQSMLAQEPLARVGQDESGQSKLSFDRPGISEWYINEAQGLHHWFKVDKKLGNGNLWIKLATSGAVAQQTGPESIQFKTSEKTLSYSGLKVWDASGKRLAASMELRGTEIVLGVDDENAVYPVTIDPIWEEEAGLSASDESRDSNFGTAVAISENTAVVGAIFADPAGVTNAGQAYVFTRTGFTWTQRAILSASDKASNGRFGSSVGISGDTIVVGSNYASPGGVSSAGQAYVFQGSGATWTQRAILTSDVPLEKGRFGCSVAASGDTVVIGENFADAGGVKAAGKAHVFTRSGGTWSRQAVLTASTKYVSALFGTSVAIDGETIAVGAMQAHRTAYGKDEGRAYAFTRTGSTWAEQAILGSDDFQDYGKFGFSVAISGDTIVVGAPREGLYNYITSVWNCGRAHVFVRLGSVWTYQSVLVASDKQPSAEFGQSVGISGDTVIIGAYDHDSSGFPDSGQAYVFSRAGTDWSEDAILSASAKAPSPLFGDFGYAAAISGNTVLVGSPFAEVGFSRDAGKAYVYSLVPSSPATVTFPVVGITGGKSVQGTVTLGNVRNKNTVVNLTSNNAALTVPASVTIPAGSTTASFTATSSSVPSDVTVTVSSSGVNIISGSTQLDVRSARVGTFTINQDSLSVGQTGSATVKLQSVAPTGGILVTLLNSNPTALDCPASILIPAGASTATFPVTGKTVAVATTVKVEATPTFAEKSDTVIITPPAALASVSIADFVVGSSRVGQVSLTAAAPTGGAVVSLASSSALLSLPTSVTVPAGATTANFTVSAANLVRNATITASYLGLSKTDLVSTVSLGIASVTSSRTTLPIGQTATVTVTLSAVTPQDLAIVVTQQTAGVVLIPATIVIPAGSTTGTFTITGGQVGVSNVYVKLLNQGVRGVKITVTN